MLLYTKSYTNNLTQQENKYDTGEDNCIYFLEAIIKKQGGKEKKTKNKNKTKPNQTQKKKKKKQTNKQKSKKEKKFITLLKKYFTSLNLSSSSRPNFVTGQSSWIRDPTTKGSKAGPLVAR